MSRSTATPIRVLAAATIAALGGLGGPGGAASGQAVGGEELSAGVYIVALTDLPLAAHPSTKPGVAGSLDTTSEVAIERAEALRESQDEVLSDIDATASQRYDTVLNGFAAELSAEQATALSTRADVVSLTPDTPRELSTVPEAGSGRSLPLTDQSPDVLGLSGPAGAWAQLGGVNNAGTGQVVAVIDSGIDWANPSFRPNGMASPPDAFDGSCETTDFDQDWPEQACNDKVVAADIFVQGPGAAGMAIADDDSMSPQDRDGHGSHVAAVATGRRTTLPLGQGGVSVAGMAPAAHLAVYKACWDITRFRQTLCYPQDSIAAIEAATTDGVDVINFSVSGSANSYLDAVELALRNASASGVFVATTAGNGGSLNRPVEHLSPWVTTTAAATYRSEEDRAPAVPEFSSRGPADILASRQTVAKPDLAAPGVSVLSAVAASSTGAPRWSSKTGTSMAAPHVAGLAALVTQRHPDWSPMAVKSALMTSSARFSGGAEANDPFAGGAGFTDAASMLEPGLVFDSGAAHWAEFLRDPAAGYTLNAPSVQVPALTSAAPTLAPRTVRNVGESSVTYTATYEGPSTLSVELSPETFTLAPGQQQAVEIAVSNTGAKPQKWQHGAVVWSAPGAADVRIPVIARGDRLRTEPSGDVVDRWAGPNRFWTAAEVAAQFTAPVDTVYLSSPNSYADALSAAPIAAQGIVPGSMSSDGNAAPILLAGSGLPEATRLALEELKPRNIVLLGGSGVTSGSLERTLERQGYRVTRVGGSNRYETSSKLATLHEPGLPVLYVASGASGAYPDALTGSALAARDGGAVLLSPPGSVPEVTREAIAALNPDKVVVLGGEKVVSDDVYRGVGASERIAGDDRYRTAAKISQRYAAPVERVYVANGQNWPDALAGSVIAGSQGAPVLITRLATVPEVIGESLQRLQPQSIVLLGGDGAVGPEVKRVLTDLATTWR